MEIGRKKIQISGEAVEDNDNDDGTRRDWARGLPEGILDMISDCLFVCDCASFVDVCISWSKVIKERFCGFPLLLTGSGQRFRYTRTCLTSLDNFSSCWEIDMPEAYMKYFWGSFHDWLILVEVKRRHFLYLLRVKLYNPFSRVTIDLPETFNSYEMLVASGRPSHTNLTRILVPYNFGSVKFWAPRLDIWHECSGPSFFNLVDAVFCGWCFYLFTSNWNIYTIDVRDVFRVLAGTGGDHDSSISAQYHEIKMLARPRMEGGVSRYLVESRGEVLLVCRVFDQRTSGTKKFIIYKLDVCEMAWKEVENLGDRVLFLGKCFSRSFSALDLGIQKANCIYFTNDWRPSLVDWWDLSQFERIRSRPVIGGLEKKFRLGHFQLES
ncbi:hypothetical protein Vadar_025364 [Vaccinium darrowii]|uniref:Uncharacterized protein n=1 Tax=Vaccinium darrowii TaxID=229202 RepID=A0ACB7Y1Y9_9ERIC|nr:hypothetical protein Vadar_025364 [Vaccinium darrowii]